MDHHNNHPDHFKELDIPEIKLHTVTWAERYREIEEISLYRAHTDESFKYVFVVTVLNPDYPYLYWEADYPSFLDDLSSFYKDKPPQDPFSHWMLCNIEQGDEIPSEFVIGDTKLSLYARKGVKSKPETKLTHRDKQKAKCREISAKLWKDGPAITIADMINKAEIQRYSYKKNGMIYMENTIRNWIKDLCPDRSPGRRPKK